MIYITYFPFEILAIGVGLAVIHSTFLSDEHHSATIVTGVQWAIIGGG